MQQFLQFYIRTYFSWTLLSNPSVLLLFLAQHPTVLSKSSHIPVRVSLSHFVPKGRSERLVVTAHTNTHQHAEYTLSPAEKTKQWDLCQQLSEWLTVSLLVLTFNKWLFLSLSVQWHKRTTRVCVREVITAFHCLLYSFHTQILGYWHCTAVKSHKCPKKHKSLHTESMGKFRTTSRETGGI